MKKAALLIAAMSLLFASGACTKPDAGNDDVVAPPQTEEKEDEETPEEPSVPVLESFSTSYGNKAVAGERLVLIGQNFDPQKEGNILLFDEVTQVFTYISRKKCLLQSIDHHICFKPTAFQRFYDQLR